MPTEIVDGEVVDTETGEVLEGPPPGVALVHRQQPTAAARQMVGGLLRPVEDVQEVMKAQQELRDMISRTLRKGRDYGKIPGIKKPTFLQPGADTMCSTYGVMPRFAVVEREIDHDREVHWTKKKWTGPNNNRRQVTENGTSYGLYRYVVECEIIHRASGVPVGHGMGSCSSLEDKYVDRPRNLENTVLKMAKKRAYIDATLTTFGLHDMFTQDVEDMAPETRQAEGGQQAGPQTRDEFLDAVITGGKWAEEKAGRQWTWRQLCHGDPKEHRGYVRWAIGDTGTEGMRMLTDEQRGWLRGECERAKAQQKQAAEKKEGVSQQELGMRDDGAKPATPDQRFEMQELSQHLGCPQNVKEFIEKQLAKPPEKLTRDKAEYIIVQTKAKIGPLLEEDDDLPF